MSRLDQIISLLTDKSRKSVAAELDAMDLTPGLVNQKINYTPDFSSYKLESLREIASNYGFDTKKMNRKAVLNVLQQTIGNYQTLLGLAIGMEKYDAVLSLLEAGADPNGITPEGLVYTPPVFYTAYIKNDTDYYRVLKTLLEKGANINQTTLNDKGLIYHTIMSNTNNYKSDWLQKRIRFLLGKGASPDGTRTYPNLQSYYLTDELVRLFIYFGANPKYKSIEGLTFSKYINQDSTGLFEKPYSSILNECKDPILLHKVAKAYKVPVKPDELLDKTTRKRVCECIQTIRDNISQIDFDDIRERRKKIIGEAYNSDTLSYSSSIYEFMSDELIFLESPKGKFIFHVSEIPILLKGKNPYTQEPLPSGFLRDVVNKYEFFPEYTVETANELLEDFPQDKGVTNRDLAEKLNEYLKTYNTYIDVENLSNVNVGMLSRIPSILEETTPGLVISNLDISRNPLAEGISSKNYSEALIRFILTNLIPIKKLSIPQIANAIQQVINGDRIIKEVVDEMGFSWDMNKNYMRYITFDQMAGLVGLEKYRKIREILSQDGDPDGYFDFLKDFFVFYA